jgi:hypothetical protein
MSNKAYDVFKFIQQIVLPALATLYFTLAKFWNLPYSEQIVGTIAAINVFLGTILKISSTNYYNSGKNIDGTMSIDPNTEFVSFDFMSGDIKKLSEKDTVQLKIDSYNK